MKRSTILFALLVCLSGLVRAQQLNTAQQLAATNLSKELHQVENARARNVNQYLALHPDARRSYIDAKGNYCYLHRIDQDGTPIYYQTRSNLALATSIGTSKLWSGGSLGLNLQGQNMEVSTSRSRLAVWEPGPTRTTHVEFGGRAITRDTPPFSTSMTSTTLVEATDHATHVTGTMVAAGIRLDARGMANQARIDCYETTDELTEQQTAASEGVLVSNHSYGPKFDDASVTKRGMYDEDAQNYDKIASNNRNYLQFHAAGNDRNESQGIQYDILLGGALAKNVLAIGAVQFLPNGYTGPSSVVMSDFSSFGPADDGRVKPDLVAPGVQITSSYSESDNAYSTINGTSMASPGAAGSLFLLQQHYKNTRNSFMKAATLKGLGIHTADEAGSADGPDYAFGWGLLNLEKAIKLINNSDNAQLLEEATLANGATYRKKITTPGGAFRVTICWTDLPGTVLTTGAANNRTPMLVNDLDVRLINAVTDQVVTTLPWKLDPANPSAGATRGDNVVDNVEQIYVADLAAGNYYIQVTHKGTLQAATVYSIGGSRVGAEVASQDFSVLATGLVPTALPVKLVRFAVLPLANDALLQWTIADAVNVSHFDLERSRDGKQFDRVGAVLFSPETTAYHYQDSSARGLAQRVPTLYYRLKLVDLDGSFSYSRIVPVTFMAAERSDQPIGYPNPFQDRFTASVPAQASSIDVLTLRGQLMLSCSIVPVNTPSEITLTGLENLPAGVYILRIQTPGQPINRQLTKQ